MALMNRVTRLFTADLHAVLDRLEEPDLLLSQAVREMEEALAGLGKEAQQLRAPLADLDRRRRATQSRVAELDDELDICFASAEEALARNLVRRKLEAVRLGAALTEQREAAARQLQGLDEAIADRQRELDALRHRLELLPKPGDDEAPQPRTRVAEAAIGDDEVEAAFLRERQARVPS